MSKRSKEKIEARLIELVKPIIANLDSLGASLHPMLSQLPLTDCEEVKAFFADMEFSLRWKLKGVIVWNSPEVQSIKSVPQQVNAYNRIMNETPVLDALLGIEKPDLVL